MFWSKKKNYTPPPDPPLTVIDTCADVVRPYSRLFGPVTLNCNMIAIKYEKTAPGTKPVLAHYETVGEYSLENEHPFVRNKC